MGDLRAEHREALVKLLVETLVLKPSRRNAGRYDAATMGDLADTLLDAGWRPRYDGAIEIVEDVGGEWRWRAVAINGQPVGGPQEGYTEREHAVVMAAKITGIYPEEQA